MTIFINKEGKFGFTPSKNIRIASTPPNWVDIRNNCGYKQVIRNHGGRAFGGTDIEIKRRMIE